MKKIANIFPRLSLIISLEISKQSIQLLGNVGLSWILKGKIPLCASPFALFLELSTHVHCPQKWANHTPN